MTTLNATHDPRRSSWVASANAAGSDFPIQNLPHGVFRREQGPGVGGVAIGDRILDLRVALEAGLFSGALSPVAEAAAEPTLNRYMEMGNGAASVLRGRLSDLLDEAGPERSHLEGMEALLVPMSAVSMALPVRIGGFTDFCTSVPHIAQERANRPASDLHPAFKHLPVAYNGRANSVVVDRTPIPRPTGQTGNPGTGQVNVRPTRSLDFELEFGALVGRGNAFGSMIGIDDAPEAIWGYVLVNDWSARDLQRWESYLGPFLGKSFATTISPWIVTAEAMAPFRGPPHARAADDPDPQPYLTSQRHAREGGLSVVLTAHLTTARSRAAGEAEMQLTDTRLSHAFWSHEQMLTHHVLNGCPLDAGDLLSSGTVSGPEAHEAACLWEITGGRTALTLPNGESRMWLEDEDEIILRARAVAPGRIPVGFGVCSGRVTGPEGRRPAS